MVQYLKDLKDSAHKKKSSLGSQTLSAKQQYTKSIYKISSFSKYQQ
jgi:hypothetical protein